MSCRHSARNRKRQHPIPPVKLLGLLLPMAAQLIIPPDDRILYCVRDRQTFGFLSHFYISPIRLNDQLWPSAEHFYRLRTRAAALLPLLLWPATTAHACFQRKHPLRTPRTLAAGPRRIPLGRSRTSKAGRAQPTGTYFPCPVQPLGL
jgi:hypothetical protein